MVALVEGITWDDTKAHLVNSQGYPVSIPNHCVDDDTTTSRCSDRETGMVEYFP